MADDGCTQDLERRLLRALEVASQAVAHFAVDGHVDAEQPLQGFGPEKPVAEAAMLLYVAHASRARPAIAERVQALAAQLVPHARAERVMLDITLNPAMAFKFAVPHILLSAIGQGDVAFDRFLAQAAATRLRDGHERTPAALMERDWITRLWATCRAAGAPTTPPSVWPARPARSLLHTPLDVLGGLRDDAYVFTHLLFYASDFGHRPNGLPVPRRTLLRQAGALLPRYLDAEDYDLSAELLLAWPFTAARWDAPASLAFRVLAAVEDECGLLPCGNVDLARLGRLQGQARARYALGTAYHTALVMGLLCAAALRPGCAPPQRLPGRPARAADLAAIQPFIDTDRGHWQAVFAALPAPDQRRLVPWLLDMAIVQTTRRRDPVALARLLQLAQQRGLAGSELWLQATERLQRLAQVSLALRARPVAGAPASATDPHAQPA